MKTLGIDIETFSPVDLTKTGVYKYAQHPEFEIMLFACAIDNGPVQLYDLKMGEHLPEEISLALTDPRVLKTAFNANFERVCIDNHFNIASPVDQWECTMVKGAMLGLPHHLAAVAKVLKLEQEKMTEGKNLIRFFSMPCKPTMKNRRRTRNTPMTDIEKWNRFKEYCLRDVEVEQAIREKLMNYEIPEFEKKLYDLDQVINDRGVLIDLPMVENAIRMDEAVRKRLNNEAVKLTGLNNPNSAAQLKEWIGTEMGEDVTSLTKAAIPELIEATECDKVTRVLEIRQEMAKTSVKKYEAMANAVCSDGRVRGLLQFYGANRTGRWAGRLVQVQNLPQNHLKDLDLARSVVRSGDLELTEILYGNVPDTLSQLIRTAFIAREGYTFVVADFSAIEARVIAWLAGEKWRLNVFNSHGKIYEASASQMFKVPLEEVTKGSPLRQKGKISELALGYQGGVGALRTMGALNMGLTEEELPELVAQWRNSNPAIVKLWNDVNNAAIEAIGEGYPVPLHHNLLFECKDNVLFIQLPSGRRLSYLRPRIESNRYGSSAIKYEGMNQTTKQWSVLETYGGKLVENIIQAIARDCLAETMINVEEAGYPIVMHVHDEVVIEQLEENAETDLKKVCAIMGQPIRWAKDLPLCADGYVTPYYKKD